MRSTSELGYLIKQDGRNQNEQPQNRESVKGKQVLCHVEKKSKQPSRWDKGGLLSVET